MFDDEARMTFTEHLGELRTRIIRSAVALLVGCVLCYVLHDQLFHIVARPLLPHQITEEELAEIEAKKELAEKLELLVPIYTRPFSNHPSAILALPFTLKRHAPDTNGPAAAAEPVRLRWVTLNPIESIVVALKLSIYGGVLVAFPYILYQILAFVFPGLKPNERKAVRFLLFGCAGLAIFGVSLAYFGIMPLILPYLMAWTPEAVETTLRMSETVSLILMFYLGFAIAFQFPMVVLILVYLELLSPETLKVYRRFAIVGIAILSAILTPADPISMIMMAIPLTILYEMSIWASYLLMYNKKKSAEAAAS